MLAGPLSLYIYQLVLSVFVYVSLYQMLAGLLSIYQLVLSVFVHLYLVSCESNFYPARESLSDVSWASPLVLSVLISIRC